MHDLLKVVQQFYNEIWTEGNEQTIYEIIHPDYHPPDVGMPEKGPDLLLKETKYFRGIFSDLKYTIIDYNIKSETEIWVVYEISGIHTSPAWGFEPTGKEATGRGLGIFTIENGKIVNQIRIYTMYDLFASSGAIPSFWELASKLK